MSKQECVNGHDTTDPESRDANGNCRSCRAAARKRSHKAKEPRKATPPATVISEHRLAAVTLEWYDRIERASTHWERDELRHQRDIALASINRTASHRG